jgi:hypothetical protein
VDLAAPLAGGVTGRAVTEVWALGENPHQFCGQSHTVSFSAP